MHQFPTGTITLLFTDIEESTLLLHQLGERYPSVLAECRQLLRAVFEQWNGYEVDTQGDSFFVVFARASDAISAAMAMQRALAAHAWPDGVMVRVRMGLHTGEPLRTTEGYVGLDVHHVARIMSVGHGGQVLLSQTTCELVKQNLPEGVSLRDLGEHRLKDLQRPGRVFQLIITGLPADFPPLKSLDNRPNNLPLQLTPFIGREQEMATVLDFLQREEVRLLTLTGPGGTGKTRLALQAAAELSEAFPDGVYFVNLAPISDPEFVVPAIAQTLDIKEIADQTLLSLLKASLQWKKVLLLLDNFEQVVGAAVYMAELLATCPVLKVLVTSRAALHVRGEQEFAVPPLAVPDPKHLPDLVTISHCEAVALFIQRAQSVKPEFQMTNANASAIAEICVRLDGLPLAIELAAARIKVLPPQALLARLGQRLAVLTGGARDAPARQQTLRKTIEWSYNLLDAAEQRLFQRLSVFVGGCRLSAVEAVSEALSEERGKALAGVASLLDKSLVQQSEQEDEEPRLVMLETIREYGLEALAACGEMEATWQAHANYYLELAEEAEPELGGPQQAVRLEGLERENDNLRAALRWSLERGEVRRSTEMALRLGGALGRFWEVRGHWSEGWNFLERALAGGKGVAVPVQVKALKAAAHLAWVQGDSDRAEALSEECLALCREIGDTAGMALSLRLLGALAYSRGNLGVAYARTEEALVLFRKVGDKQGIAQSLANFAHVLREQGEYKRAIAHQEEALALFRAVGNIEGIAFSLLQLARVIFVSLGDPATVRALLEEGRTLCRVVGHKDGMSWILSRLGEVFLQQGDTIKSRSLLEESVVLSREIGKRNFAWPLFVLGKVAESQGDYAAARARYEESLSLGREVGDNLSIPFYLEGLAGLVAIQGDPAWAARLWGMAEGLRETMGTPLPPVYRADYEQALAAARAQLGEKAFAKAWSEGRTMTTDQALAARGPTMGSSSSSMGERISAPPTTSTVTYPSGLTAREVEVLGLVAQGLTDAQIAEQLIISPRTVNSHLTSIYSKIQVSSRTAASRYAFEQKLV